MPKLNRPRKLIPAGAGSAPAQAATSLLIVRYPAAIDAPPTITDEDTPLSGIFHSYLALLLEAVMAELGPLTEVFRNPNIGSLMQFLGVELGSSISNWRSFTKSAGGNEAGQVFGLIKVRFQTAVSGYNVRNAITNVNPRSGGHAGSRVPVLFCQVSNQIPPALSGADMATAVGGGVRGQAGFQSPTVYRADVRGCPGTATGGTPTAPGNPQVSTHVLFLFMHEAF